MQNADKIKGCFIFLKYIIYNLLLLRCIHFCDNTQQIKGDRLYKIQMVLTEVKKNFKDAMIPFQIWHLMKAYFCGKGVYPLNSILKVKGIDLVSSSILYVTVRLISF